MSHSVSTPIYTPDRIHSPAYHLRYAWFGWPSSRTFPPQPDSAFFAKLDELWEADGIRWLEMTWSPQQIQLTCSVKPTVSPILFTARMKGRLQHALRHAKCATPFSRKIAFRTIGENRRPQVEAYIARQVSKEGFVDDRFADFMSEFTVENKERSLGEPTETASGRYWYNIHLVLVTDSRMRMTDRVSLDKMNRMAAIIAEKKGHFLSIRSVMPDHIHIAMRGNIESSPEDIALGFMNNFAFAFGQNAIFRPSYYVGSFGEYDMGAVRD